MASRILPKTTPEEKPKPSSGPYHHPVTLKLSEQIGFLDRLTNIIDAMRPGPARTALEGFHEAFNGQLLRHQQEEAANIDERARKEPTAEVTRDQFEALWRAVRSLYLIQRISKICSEDLPLSDMSVLLETADPAWEVAADLRLQFSKEEDK